MFINFWYPVVLSADLTDQPRRVPLLGLHFAAYRDSAGQARVLADVCPHRGGSLAAGKVRGDHLQCPYHGWQFDGTGHCQRIPSLGKDAKIPARTRVDAYPVVEKYGIVFAFLGDLPENERPPLLEIPEYGREGWRATLMRYDAPFSYERSVENGLDPAHNEFVHPAHGYSGENSDYKVGDLRWVAQTEWGGGFFVRSKSPASTDPDFAKFKQATDSREAGTGSIGPNQVWTYIRFGPGKAMHQYMWEAPVDEDHTVIFFLNMRSTLLEPDMDAKVQSMNWVIAEQDIRVLSELQPRLTPPTNTREFMVPADEPILRYRQRTRDWESRGWRIDGAALAAARSRAAFAVPSPGRRESRGWVLDPVPLMAAAERDARQEPGTTRQQSG
jgi:phenylpropionate dioxygenase-like ring-hydroxylating dioxygenase large terminal subunit